MKSSQEVSGRRLQQWQAAHPQLAGRAPAWVRQLVLAADQLPPMAELTVRLATLTAQAPDVQTTMEAVATGLLLGTRTSWGGRYLAW